MCLYTIAIAAPFLLLLVTSDVGAVGCPAFSDINNMHINGQKWKALPDTSFPVPKVAPVNNFFRSYWHGDQSKLLHQVFVHQDGALLTNSQATSGAFVFTLNFEKGPPAYIIEDGTGSRVCDYTKKGLTRDGVRSVSVSIAIPDLYSK